MRVNELTAIESPLPFRLATHLLAPDTMSERLTVASTRKEEDDSYERRVPQQ